VRFTALRAGEARKADGGLCLCVTCACTRSSQLAAHHAHPRGPEEPGATATNPRPTAHGIRRAPAAPWGMGCRVCVWAGGRVGEFKTCGVWSSY
jgi:hypothetical protein